MIIIENLCKAYNDKILFKNFHLEIPDSSFLVISGESGCGKSTLLNMIGGIETPDKGSIIVNGFDVTKKGKKQKYFKEVVGFLFQNFALLENKTVKENLEIFQRSCWIFISKFCPFGKQNSKRKSRNNKKIR